MATDTNILRPARKIVPTLGQKTGPTMRLGSVTQRFFAEGEEHEAREYKDVVLDVDEAPDASELEFDSFDEIPRKRRPLLMTAGVLSLVAVGAIAWKTTHGLPRHNQVKAAAEAMVAGPPASAPLPSVAAAAPPPAMSATAASEEPAASASAPATASENAPERLRREKLSREKLTQEKLTIEPIAANPSAANPVVIPLVVSTHQLAVLPARHSMQLEGTAAAGETDMPSRAARTADTTTARVGDSMPAGAVDPSDSTTPPRRARRAPLHGYVWSPEANAMVPAGSVTPSEPSAAAAAREPSLGDSPERTVAPSDEPAPAASTTSATGPSDPTSTARTDPERAPIIE